MTFDDCEKAGGRARTMLFGPFAYDAAHHPQWVIPQLGLYRVTTNPGRRLARSGTLSISTDDPRTGVLELDVNVQFEGASVKGALVIGR